MSRLKGKLALVSAKQSFLICILGRKAYFCDIH